MSRSSWEHVESQGFYRYGVYELLRRVFLWKFPLELFLEMVRFADAEWRSSKVDGAAELAFKECLASLADSNLSAAYRDIHIEYTRLFVGPHHLPAPPYESVYRSPDRMLMQDETMRVRAAYARSGFRVARSSHVPDDNVGIEFEFMCALSMATNDAVGKKDCAEALLLIAAQQEFCNDHLAKWIPQFCADIKEDSSSTFWQGVAVFTKEFIEAESDALIALRKDLEELSGSSEPGKIRRACEECDFPANSRTMNSATRHGVHKLLS
jgi:TorA maturation chaperone TorD